ncbi:MAG: uracil-DNA glycosylase family protein [Bacteroidota bacterium]
MPAAYFDTQILRFINKLDPRFRLPTGVRLLNPYQYQEIRKLVTVFYNRYYHDRKPRRFLLGINPGRLGAGLTGIPFTDPVCLTTILGIDHHLPLKPESSATFVYEVINAMGGPKPFFEQIYLGSVCPLGFTKDEKNCNYYDQQDLLERVKPFIIDSIEGQLAAGAKTDFVISLGEGENFKQLRRLNEQHGWFEDVKALPHPRFVMQYKRKQKNAYIDRYLELLCQ